MREYKKVKLYYKSFYGSFFVCNCVDSVFLKDSESCNHKVRNSKHEHVHKVKDHVFHHSQNGFILLLVNVLV